MPGSEEPEESKSCQRCIIDEAERKGRGKRRERAERIWLVLQDEASTEQNKKSVQIDVLILIWRRINYIYNTEMILSGENLNCVLLI